MKVKVIPIVVGELWMIPRGFLKLTGRVGNKMTSRDHLNRSIIKIGQNTEKSPGELRRLAGTQTPVEDHRLMLWKTFKGLTWSLRINRKLLCYILTPRPGPKILFQGNTPEGSDTFQRPVIERDRVGGLRLMISEKVKVPFCHYSHAPEESNLWTAWQLFPLDDD